MVTSDIFNSRDDGQKLFIHLTNTYTNSGHAVKLMHPIGKTNL